MDSDTTTSTTLFPSDTESSELETPSSFSSSQELDDAALAKTPTMSVVNRQAEYERTPTQASVLKYRPPTEEDVEKPTSVSRRLFIIPPIGDDPFTDDSDLEEPMSLIHLLGAAVQRRASDSAIVLNQTDWTKQLPMKVLEHIFAFYIYFFQVSLHPVNKPYVVPCPTSGPLLLSHVSKYWRDTALACPLIWASLSVGNNQPSLALLESWLSRSHRNPLSLRLNLNLSPTNAEYVMAVLDLFARHLGRWQMLDLRLNNVLANKLCTVLGFTNTNPSLVQIRRIRLDTKLCNTRVISKLLFVLEGFHSLEGFIHANSSRQSFLSYSVCGSPLWPRLTYIDISATLSQFECTLFLSQCTSALSVTFQSIRNSKDKQEPHIVPYILPHLQHFDIVASTIDICSTILPHLTCPSLNSLSIVTASSVSETPAHLGAFLARSACPLYLFNIFDWQMNIRTFIPLIRAITTSGAGVGSRTRIKTLGIYSTEMPRKRGKFYKALRDEEKRNGSLGIKIDRIDYWGLFNPDGWTYRTRVGWGKRPAYL